MNTFTRKALYAAIAGVAAIGVASTANAVNISADGLGQVLIYPYYTVRNNASGLPYNTLLSVVNTTASVKAIKVRFREGRNSVEVLDFNVFLSPFDVWTATVSPAPQISGSDPAAAGAQISTTDSSCTIPDSLRAGTPQSFRTSGLEATDNAVSRTAEGYFEIFEMATEGGVTAVRAIHDKTTGVPSCGITNALAKADQKPATGGLFGGLIIVNPAGGGAFSQAATALANFAPGVGYQDTGTLSPQMANADPVSNVIQGGQLYSSVWTNGNDAVAATLLGNAVTNEFVLDAGTKSQTSWIITMPTKDAYVNTGTGLPPFTTRYISKVGACEPTFAIVFNREEASPQVVSNDDFSPVPPNAPGPTICWEATSVNFNGSNVFGSTNTNTLTTKFSNGWSTFGFNDPTTTDVHKMVAPLTTQIFNLSTAVVTTVATTYSGLPVVGFSAETFQNDALVVNGKSFLSTFGAEFVHHKTTKISP